MPEELTLYKDIVGHTSLTYTSSWVDVSTTQTIVLTAISSVNYTMSIRWATDDTYTVIDTDTNTVLAAVTGELFLATKARFIQIHMIFASQPCNFTNQFFFFQ